MGDRGGVRSAADVAAELTRRRLPVGEHGARQAVATAAVESLPSPPRAQAPVITSPIRDVYNTYVRASVAGLISMLPSFGGAAKPAAAAPPAAAPSSLLALKVPASNRKSSPGAASSGHVDEAVLEHVQRSLTDRCASLLSQDGRASIPLVGVDDAVSRVTAHVRSAVCEGAGGSLVLLGPRGAGKRSIINDCIARVQRESNFDVLSLDASTVSDDAAAMRELSRLIECASLRPIFHAFKSRRVHMGSDAVHETAATPVPAETARARPSDATVRAAEASADALLKRAPETSKYLQMLAHSRLEIPAASAVATSDERVAARKMRLAREIGDGLLQIAADETSKMSDSLKHAWKAIMHGVPLPSSGDTGAVADSDEQIDLTQPVTADADGAVMLVDPPVQVTTTSSIEAPTLSRKRGRPPADGDKRIVSRTKARSAAWIDTNKNIYDHHLHSVTRALCPGTGDDRGATVIVIHDIDRLAHASRQTFLYHVLDMACAPTSRVSIIATSSRIDLEALLEKRLRSRLAPKIVCLNPGISVCTAVMEQVLRYPFPLSSARQAADSVSGNLAGEVATFAHALRSHAAICDHSTALPALESAADDASRTHRTANAAHDAFEAVWRSAVRDLLRAPECDAYWRACGYACSARHAILAARDMVHHLSVHEPLPRWEPLLQHACVRSNGVANPHPRVLLSPPLPLPQLAMLSCRTMTELLLLGAMAHMELRASESSRDGDMHTLMTHTKQDYNFSVIFHELRATLLGARSTARRAAIVAAMQVHGAAASAPQEGVSSRHVASEEVTLVAFERLVDCGLVRLLPRKWMHSAGGDSTADADDASATLVSNTLQLSHAAAMRDTTPQLRDSKSREDLRNAPCCLLMEPLALLDAVRQGHVHMDTSLTEWMLHGGKEAPGL